MPLRVVPAKGEYSYRLLWDCDNTRNSEPQKHTHETKYSLQIDQEEVVNTLLELKASVDFEHKDSVNAKVLDVGVSSDNKFGFAASALTTTTINRGIKSSYTESQDVKWEFTVGAGAHLKFYQVQFSLPGVTCLTSAYIQVNGDTQPTPSTFDVEFKIEEDGIPLPLGRYFIQSPHNTYLTARPGGEGAKVELTGSKEPWTLISVGGTTKVGLLSSQGTLLRAQPGAEGAAVDLQINRSNWSAQPWEQWTLIPATKGRFGLLSTHGLLLRASPNGHVDQQVYRSNWDAQPWEQLTFIPVNHP